MTQIPTENLPSANAKGMLEQIESLLQQGKDAVAEITAQKKILDEIVPLIASPINKTETEDVSIQGKLNAILTSMNSLSNTAKKQISISTKSLSDLEEKYINNFDIIFYSKEKNNEDSLEFKLNALISNNEESTTKTEEKLSKIENIVTEAQGILEKINEIKTLIDKQSALIDNYKEELLGDNSDKKSIKQKIDSMYSKIEEMNIEIKSLFDDLFEKNITEGVWLAAGETTAPNDEEVYTDKKTGRLFYHREKTIPGKSKHFQDAIDNIKQLTQTTDSKFEETFKKIETLLPGATSAGLAHAHHKAHRQHTIYSIVWSVLFLASIAGMVAMPFVLNNYGIISISQISTQGDQNLFYITIINILKLSPFILPLIWFSYFANTRTKEHRHISEIYLFKWSIAISYSGLKEQAKETISEEDTSLLQRILENVVTSNQINPSSAIDLKKKHDNPMLNYIEDLPSEEKKEMFKKIQALLNVPESIGSAVAEVFPKK